jgi:DNA-binding Lrp family transcriptional regulator
MNNYPIDDSSTDLVAGSAKVALSMIPIAGAPLVEILNLLVTPTLQKRRDKWFIELGDRLKKLEDDGYIKLEDLQTNDEFIDISIKATEIALKTSEEEKLKALQNALLNTTIDTTIDLSIKQIFINNIDTFTVWHIKLLKLFDNPKQYENVVKDISMGGLSTLIEGVYPELKSKQDFYRLIIKDLFSSGFTTIESVGTTMTKNGILSQRTSSLGKQFIKYISDVEV